MRSPAGPCVSEQLVCPERTLPGNWTALTVNYAVFAASTCAWPSWKMIGETCRLPSIS